MKAAAPRARPDRDGGARREVPRTGVEGWLDDTSFSAGPDPFRAAMRHHAKGVAVITAGAENPVGFCATSLASVSLEPAVVSFSIGLGSSSWRTVESARHVMVHLLADSQADLASRFGRTNAAKFGPGTRWHRGALGLPVLDDVLAWLLLALTSYFPVGDHALVLGRVIASRHAATGGPLIHHNREFAALAGKPAGRGEDQPPGAGRRRR